LAYLFTIFIMTRLSGVFITGIEFLGDSSRGNTLSICICRIVKHVFFLHWPPGNETTSRGVASITRGDIQPQQGAWNQK